MKNRISAFLKRQWLVLWILLMSVMIFAIIASAEFPSALSSMKRVVAAADETGAMFSSNVLIEGGSKTYIPSYKRWLPENKRTAENSYGVEVYIWNYSLDDPMSWYPDDIKYNVTFTLTDMKGKALEATDIDAAHTVKVIAYDSKTVTLGKTKLNSTGESISESEYTLVYETGHSAQHKFELQFSGIWDLEEDEDICVRMEAVPVTAGATDLRPIAAVIGLREIQGSGASGWKVYLNEDPQGTTTDSVNKYDGFNIVASGSGAADITIQWDTRYVDINKHSYSVVSDSKSVFGYLVGSEIVYQGLSGNIATLVIHADTGKTTQENRNRYNLQLYKTGNQDPSGWNFFRVNSGTVGDGSCWVRVDMVQK